MQLSSQTEQLKKSNAAALEKASQEQNRMKEDYEHKIVDVQNSLNKEFKHQIEVLS